MSPSGGTNPYTYRMILLLKLQLQLQDYQLEHIPAVTDNGAKSWSLNYNEEFNGAIEPSGVIPLLIHFEEKPFQEDMPIIRGLP